MFGFTNPCFNPFTVGMPSPECDFRAVSGESSALQREVLKELNQRSKRLKGKEKESSSAGTGLARADPSRVCFSCYPPSVGQPTSLSLIPTIFLITSALDAF